MTDEDEGQGIHAAQALLPEGWAREVRVTVAGAKIAAVKTGAAPRHGDVRVGALLPALGNLHSHSFQRALAGLGEAGRPGQDSFWTWRTLMYAFLERLTPEDVEAIAAQVFVEMLEAGYAAVGEFHYLHHAQKGAPYDDPAEMGGRIAAAAGDTGIGLTHLPVFYAQGGTRARALEEGQKRFGCDLDRFERLHEASARAVSGLPGDTRLGVAPHSLRAVTPESLAALIAAHPSGPVHIHAAEQVREVEEVAAWLGRRPIDWLLSEMGLDPRWCVIHATHMTAAETVGLAQSGAVAGLCPITEANLGDGIFPGPEFLAAQGRFGVGSDSNVRIALGEELRTLEYGQRLSRRSRNCMAPPAEEGAAPRSTGEALYLSACAGGAQALGRPSGALRVGLLADLVALDTKQPVLAALPTDRLLDGLVFAAGDGMVADVWSAGRHLVENGRHAKRQSVAQRFVATMHRLVEDL